jgi:hypothetical protein
MRPSLPHPLRERRHPRERRRVPGAGRIRLSHRPTTGLDVPDPTGLAVPDPAVLRVREAGGPVDQACYTCACGYLFVASVSTTVSCPHCGARQAW